MKSAMRVTVLALLACLFVPGSPADAGSGSGGSSYLTPKKAAAQFKKMTNMYLKECRKNLKQNVKNFCDFLKDLETDIKNGDVEVEDVVEELSNATSEAYAFILDEATQTAADIAFQGQNALSFLEPGSGVPDGMMGGDCGTLDIATFKIGKELDKTIDKLEKKVKKFAKGQLKKNDLGMTVLINAPQPPPLAPAPPPEPPMKPLKADYSLPPLGTWAP